jgi:hypothetical protein
MRACCQKFLGIATKFECRERSNHGESLNMKRAAPKWACTVRCRKPRFTGRSFSPRKLRILLPVWYSPDYSLNLSEIRLISSSSKMEPRLISIRKSPEWDIATPLDRPWYRRRRHVLEMAPEVTRLDTARFLFLGIC